MRSIGGNPFQFIRTTICRPQNALTASVRIARRLSLILTRLEFAARAFAMAVYPVRQGMREQVAEPARIAENPLPSLQN